ncbi:MAG: hypothetical protein ACR2GC_02910 [Methyloceanibacter sp.]|uniref:hypothetical protein n=1 Tax=Methyloceanibacter sp. TaxID=1965321 RepID=UPI003D9AE5AE
MKQEHDKHEGETFDLKQAKAHYIAMPTWERFALWRARRHRARHHRRFDLVTPAA